MSLAPVHPFIRLAVRADVALHVLDNPEGNAALFLPGAGANRAFQALDRHAAVPVCYGRLVVHGDALSTGSGCNPGAFPAPGPNTSCQWVSIEITCRLGEPDPGIGRIGLEDDGVWTVRVLVPGQQEQVFDALPVMQEEFKDLRGVHFISLAEAPARFFLDDIDISCEE